MKQTALYDYEKKYSEIIRNSDKKENIYALIESIKYYDSSVLIVGETVTGKELVAWAIHYVSIVQLENMVIKEDSVRLNIIFPTVCLEKKNGIITIKIRMLRTSRLLFSFELQFVVVELV